MAESPASTDVEVASGALVMIGASPITSFTEDTTESLVAANIYEDVARDALTASRWRFATNQAELNRLTAEPTARWTAAYQKPDGIIQLHAVTINDVPIAYDTYGDKIYCDASTNDTVVADYTYRADEADWPSYFILAMQMELASIFAISVARDSALSRLYDDKFERFLARAKSRDSQQQTNRKLTTNRFIAQRRS